MLWIGPQLTLLLATASFLPGSLGLSENKSEYYNFCLKTFDSWQFLALNRELSRIFRKKSVYHWEVLLTKRLIIGIFLVNPLNLQNNTVNFHRELSGKYWSEYRYSFDSIVWVSTIVGTKKSLEYRYFARYRSSLPNVNVLNLFVFLVCPNIISRSNWTDILPQEVKYITVPVEYVIITNYGFRNCYSSLLCRRYIEEIRHDHMDIQGFNDIGFK